ncbi:MAG: ROK family protein [Alphaproteobacteria bacterium]|nr:ROK family protein [Alphaproteobacteria bacterium]
MGNQISDPYVCVGIDIGGTKTSYAGFDQNGTVLDQATYPTAEAAPSVLAKRFRDEHIIPRDYRILSVDVGAAGVVKTTPEGHKVAAIINCNNALCDESELSAIFNAPVVLRKDMELTAAAIPALLSDFGILIKDGLKNAPAKRSTVVALDFSGTGWGNGSIEIQNGRVVSFTESEGNHTEASFASARQRMLRPFIEEIVHRRDCQNNRDKLFVSREDVACMGGLSLFYAANTDQNKLMEPSAVVGLARSGDALAHQSISDWCESKGQQASLLAVFPMTTDILAVIGAPEKLGSLFDWNAYRQGLSAGAGLRRDEANARAIIAFDHTKCKLPINVLGLRVLAQEAFADNKRPSNPHHRGSFVQNNRLG